MSLRWFRPDGPRGAEVDLAAYQAQLEPFGIILKHEVGRATYFIDDESGELLMEIGSLVYWPYLARINCFPRLRLDPGTKAILLGSASQAFREGRFNRANNWRSIRAGAKHGEHKGKPGWRSEILVPVTSGDVHSLIAQARESVEREDFDVLSETTTSEDLQV